MSVDWKPRIISKHETLVVSQAPVGAATSTSAGADEVKVAPDSFDTSKEPTAQTFTQTQAPVAGGLKPYAVRAGQLSTSKAWFTNMPELPSKSLTSTSSAQAVVVDGVSFSQGDIAALLRLAA